MNALNSTQPSLEDMREKEEKEAFVFLIYQQSSILKIAFIANALCKKYCYPQALKAQGDKLNFSITGDFSPDGFM